MNIEIGSNLASVLLSCVTAFGAALAAYLSHLNGRKIREVAKNTNGMTEQLRAAAFKDGVDHGRYLERQSNGQLVDRRQVAPTEAHKDLRQPKPMGSSFAQETPFPSLDDQEI